MSNFWKRAITGALFVVVMVGGIYWSYWSMCMLFFLIAMLGLNEFYGLLKHANIYPQHWVGMGVSAIMFALVAFEKSFGVIFLLMLPFIAAIFFIELYRNKPNPFVNIAMTIVGILYVALPFILWVGYLSPYILGYAETHQSSLLGLIDSFIQPKYNPDLLLGFFFILWTNDTGAYLSGMALGKHKLWERISPKKTWEGFIGGAILSAVVAFVISRFYTELSYVMWISIGLIISIFGTLGDLVESMLKRSIDVKESGGLLPGHGGILDRFDGVLLSTPVLLGFLQAAQIWTTFSN